MTGREYRKLEARFQELWRREGLNAEEVQELVDIGRKLDQADEEDEA